MRRTSLCAMTILGLCLAAVLAPALHAQEAAAPADDAFSIVVVPDTQLYSLRTPDTYLNQTTWIRDNAANYNIKMAVHVGDIVHNNTKAEWEAADRAHKVLDGVVPYSLTLGNHDMPNVNRRVIRDTTMYAKYFPPSRFEGQPWYGGHKDDVNDNNFCLFEAAGMKFLVLSLEFAPTDAAIEWGAKVLADHPDHRAIVATHCYMRPNGRENAGGKMADPPGASGEQIWQKLIRKQPNVFMVLCGHVPAVGYQKSTNDAGGPVHEILTDYQNLPNGGDGWLRVLRFVPSENKIRIRAYSPLLDKENNEPAHSFEIDYEMDKVPLKKAG